MEIANMKVRGMEEEEEEEEEEARAGVEIMNLVFGYVKMAVVKCAIELEIADVIQNHGSPMPLSELTTALKCEPSRLHRIMRFLVHYKIFKAEPIGQDSIGFSLTPLSRRLTKHGEKSMAAYILLESSPVMLAAWNGLSARVLESGNISPFEAVNGKDICSFSEANPGYSQLFDEAMACTARVTVAAVIEECPYVFDGIESLVDIGGGNGTTLNLLVKAFPWIRGINFDLAHVIDAAPKFDGIKNVAGDMFVSIPNAGATLIMFNLVGFNDDDCIKILKKCREAIPNDKGKVIIVDTLLQEDKSDELGSISLTLDMCMASYTTNGKVRTSNEWSHVIRESGFTQFDVKHIRAIHSVIEAYS